MSVSASDTKTLDTFSQHQINSLYEEKRASLLNKSNFFNFESFFICQLSDVCISIVNVILTGAKLPNLQFCLCRLNFAHSMSSWLDWQVHDFTHWFIGCLWLTFVTPLPRLCSLCICFCFISLSLFLSFCFNSIWILLFSTVSHSFILRLHLTLQASLIF